MVSITTTTRPVLRFLLPRGTRLYSSPRLAKPTKFTPPSHRTRVPKDPINYPGPAIKQDPTKHYPHTLPPPETWAYFLLTNRRLHFYLSLGILAALAGTVSITNFLKTSPFASEIEWQWSHPVASARRFGAAWKKSVDDESRRTAEMRRRKVEDVEKRGEYRRAHGLEQTGDQGGFGGFGTKRKGEDAREFGEVEAARKALEAVRRAKVDKDEVEEMLRRDEEAAMAAVVAEGK